MSKKEKVFSTFAKIADILNFIFKIIAILNFATSFVSFFLYLGLVINIIKIPFVCLASSIAIPGLVFTILGFKGDEKIARIALTEFIHGIIFTVLSIVVAIVLSCVSSLIIAFLISLMYFVPGLSF